MTPGGIPLVTPDGPLPATPPQSIAELERILATTTIERARRAGYKMKAYFPDEGPYRRALYPKHTAFMAAGKTHKERLMLSGNRVGKTSVGAFETACHLTGLYPPWWTGHRFDRDIKAWAAGDTNKTVYEIIQVALLGAVGETGTGMIPAHTIAHITHKPSYAGAADTIWVKHVNGRRSSITLKSYEQGRIAFQGTTMDVIWLDEEPPQDIAVECVVRTMTSAGLVFMTFTPLQGTTRLISDFMSQAAQDALAPMPDQSYAAHLAAKGGVFAPSPGVAQ